ncbi:MAG: hypothetical protein HZA53_17040 [Planctomycetes bacterium]|nr:hypothetical protein [Planctomycetota bacterium]
MGNLSHPDLKELVPALRWLAADGATSGDPAEWRRLLEARANPRRAPRENLVLPPAAARG